MEVLIDRDWSTLKAGQFVLVPAGTPHAFRNRSGVTVRFLNEHRPALRFEEYFRAVHRLSEAGKIKGGFDVRGALYACVLMEEYADTMQPAGDMQRVMVGGLAAVGRLLGIAAQGARLVSAGDARRTAPRTPSPPRRGVWDLSKGRVYAGADVIRMDKLQSTKLDLRGIGWFLAIAFGIAWLLAALMWLGGGLDSPSAAILYPAVNFVPMVATFIVIRWIHPLQGVRRARGLQFGAPGSRWALYWLFGWLGFIAFGVAAPFVGHLFGLFPMDLTHFSLYRESVQNAPGGEQFLAVGSIRTVVLVGLLTLPLWVLLLTPFSFGEEWSWRGYLLPQLLPLGQWRALLISGAIWGLWHAPLIVLGANYPGHPILG